MSQVTQVPPVGGKSQSMGEHVVVKSIDIVFDDGIKPSKQLDVFVADKRKTAKRIKANLPERTHRWTFKDGLYVFPNDKLSIRPLHSRKTKPIHVPLLPRDHIDSYNILAKDIISRCTDPSHPASSLSDELDYTGALPGKYSNITLNVILREFTSTLVEVDTSSLNPDTKLEILESLSSSESLQDAVSQLQSVFSIIGANVEVVENLENMLETVASVHPITKAAVTALLIPYKLLMAEHEFKHDLQSLVGEMRFMLRLLEDGRWIAKISSTKETVMEIMKEIIDTSLFIHGFVNKGRFQQFGASQTHSKLDEHREHLKKLRDDFETALDLQNAGVIADIANSVNKTAEDDIEKGAKEFLKEKLEPATQQPLGDLCLQGTRATILADVEKWLKDSSRPNVLWISGAPGAGKSTISATVVKKLLKYRCARFFVKRGATPELRDPRRIWRTIAFDLAEKYRGVKDDITNALREKEAEYPKDAEIGDQFRALLEAPIRKHAESFPTDCPCVVIIDALDECRTGDGDWSDLLETLVGWSNLPSNVKLIVTSRNEKDIRDSLHAVSKCISLRTGNDVLYDDDESKDIKHLFQALKRVGASDEQIGRLTNYAAGLFLWAKTVVRFVDAPHRLDDICRDVGEGSASINDLYEHILSETFAGLGKEESDVAAFVLAAISLGRSPLAIQDLVELQAPSDDLRRTNSIVRKVVGAFSSIINVRESNELLFVCHKTLSDFLADETHIQKGIKTASERAQKPAGESKLRQYTVCRSEQNARLAEACLRLMNKKLKFNICHVPTSHRFNEDIPNRDALVKEHIPRILFYACQYWAEHLDAVDESASQTQDAVLPALKDFLWTHILHWLEIISLTGSMSCVPFSLSCAERFTKVWGDDALSELARDAKQFVATFKEVIVRSAPHIYLSALPFAPAESKVAQVYGPRHPNTLSVLTGRLASRSEMLPVAEMRGHYHRITCLVYLPDGKRIASGSEDSTIRIWDAHSGRPIAGAVLVHPGKVLALSPSPKGGDEVASLCGDGTFRVWDINENRCTFSMKVIQDGSSRSGFERGEISPDWENCAAARRRKPFKVRGTKDGQLKGSTKIRAGGYGNIMKFLPDGSSLICASGRSIIIRNTTNWETDGMPIGTELDTDCLAVSADGKMFASCDFSGTIQLYNCQERRPLGNPMQHNCHVSEFSADGNLLVSASSLMGDGTLYVWDTKTQKLIGGPHRFPEPTGALSFSPDGSRLAVAVYDRIEVFDVESCHGVLDERPSDVMHISCIAFDKLRHWFATVTKDGVVRVWDAHSRSVLAEWVGSEIITSLAFVQDSDVIAFSSKDGHVRKWNWKTGKLCHELVIDSDRHFLPNISPDGRHIAFPVKGEARHISLWDYDTDCEVRRFVTHVYWPTFTFSPDGELIAIETSVGKIEIWKVAFAADNDEPPAYLVDWETRSKLKQFVFSPDVKQLAFYASKEEEAQLHVWDFETRSEPTLLGKSTSASNTLSFSLLGNTIVASSWDGTVQFWDVSTGESSGEVPVYSHLAYVKAVELLNDGTLISVGTDGAIKVWDVGLDEGLRPRLLQSVNVLDPSNTADVAFVEDSSSVPPWRIVRENRNKSASPDSSSILYPAFFDGLGAPAIGDWCYISKGNRGLKRSEGNRGWMRSEDNWIEGWVQSGRANGEKSDDDPILFWIPPANRDNFWWPRLTAITNPSMVHLVTQIDFSRFVHGENWHLCGEPDLLTGKKRDA